APRGKRHDRRRAGSARGVPHPARGRGARRARARARRDRDAARGRARDPRRARAVTRRGPAALVAAAALAPLVAWAAQPTLKMPLEQTSPTLKINPPLVAP